MFGALENLVRYDADTGGAGSGAPAAGDTGTPPSSDGQNAGKTPDAGGTGDTGQQKPGGEATFTQADVDRIVTERLKRASDKAEADRKKAEEAAAAKAAEEQGEFKKLYEEEKVKRETAEAERKALEVAALRLKVARANGIPDELADRLRGETEEEITEDAKAMKEFVPRPGTNLNEQNGTGGNSATPMLSEEQINEYAARMGVKPEFFKPENMKLPKRQ